MPRSAGEAKEPRLSAKTRASSVVAEEDVGRSRRSHEAVDQGSAAKPPLPEAPGERHDGVPRPRGLDGGRERQAVVECSITTERQDFEALAGDDLSARDEQQAAALVAARDEAVRFVRPVEGPAPLRGTARRGAKPPEMLHAGGLGEQQPTRMAGVARNRTGGVQEVGEGAVEEPIAVEARVEVHVAVEQERAPDGLPRQHHSASGSTYASNNWTPSSRVSWEPASRAAGSKVRSSSNSTRTSSAAPRSAALSSYSRRTESLVSSTTSSSMSPATTSVSRCGTSNRFGRPLHFEEQPRRAVRVAKEERRPAGGPAPRRLGDDVELPPGASPRRR